MRESTVTMSAKSYRTLREEPDCLRPENARLTADNTRLGAKCDEQGAELSILRPAYKELFDKEARLRTALEAAPKPQSPYVHITELAIAWEENYARWYEDQRQAALGTSE